MRPDLAELELEIGHDTITASRYSYEAARCLVVAAELRLRRHSPDLRHKSYFNRKPEQMLMIEQSESLELVLLGQTKA